MYALKFLFREKKAKILDEVMEKEILELAPPDMLHVGKLGPPNDVMDHMFLVDEIFMSQFYYNIGIL